MRISDDDVTAIRMRADIAELIGHYIPLVKKGKSYTAVCPFHDDHEPSLSISRDKQIYKCFSCGNGGNVFTFVQNFEKCSFIEAVVKVAEIVNYPLQINQSYFEKKKDPRKEGLYKCLNEAISYMKFQLNATEGVEYLNYLQKRGLSKTIVEMFDIGYNGQNDQVTKFLKAKGYQQSDMIASGIARLNEFDIKDVFFNRITFPIHDSLGNPIAFTARSIDPSVKGKYINSNETEIYVKGHTVYNYHRAKEHARKHGYVLVCEGVMDVLAFARAELYNAVATLGTACTKEQIRLLKQCASKIVFCYDGDLAGRKATMHAVELAINLGCNVSIIKNDSGLDPDEIVNQYGVETLQQMVKKEVVYMEFVFEEFQKQYDLQNYSDKKKFALEVKQKIDLLNDDFDRQSFMHKLTTLTGFSSSQLGENANNVVNKKTHTKKLRLNPLQNGKTNAENVILSQMLLHINASEIFKSELGFLSNEISQQCAMLIVDYYRKKTVMSVADLLDSCTSNTQKDLILTLTESELYMKDFSESYLLGALKRFKRALLEERLQEIQGQLKSLLNTESKEILINEKTQLQRELGELKNEE